MSGPTSSIQNFEAEPSKDLFSGWNGAGWYYLDELGENLTGPFLTEEAAHDEFIKYLEHFGIPRPGDADYLEACAEGGGVTAAEFEEHLYQANLPDSDPRKRD